MALKSTLLVCLIICCQISHVTAVSECSSAIVASVFGTIAVILLIAGLAALVWYCRQKRSGKLSSKSSVESASEPEISLGTKAKGGQVGLNGHGTPVTFSHHYKEEAPSAAYNTKGVVNPAFGGQREVLIDMPSKEDGEVKIDMDGDSRFELPSSKEREVKIDMGEGPQKEIPTTKGDINLDMDIDLGMNVSNEGSPKMSSRDAELPDVEFHHNKPSGIGFPGGDVPGADTDFVFEGSSTPTFDVYGPKNMETIDVDLDRPESGGFGLLIARDKTLPPPALFVREVTPGGVAARTGLVDKGDKIVGINGTPIEGLAHDKAMRLLRNDDNPRIKLTLLKNPLQERNGSLNLPERSLDLSKTIDESCTVDVEPGLEAGIPSLDVEGLQGSADLRETETSLNISEFDGDGPQVRIAGPNMKPHSLQGSSSNLKLPSPKTKRAKCFSCLSKGDRGEPYTKENTSDRLDWDRPSADRSSQGRLKAQLSGPNVDASAGKFKGSKTNVDVSPAGELPSSKKKRGNCFSCAGDGDKSDPYKTTRGNVGINLSSPDGSTEMVKPRSMDIAAIEGPNKGISTGPPEISLHVKDPTINTPDVSIPSGTSDIGISGAGDIFSKRPKVEMEANSPDIDGPKGKLDTDISVPDADISHGDLRGPRAQIDAPSGKLNLPSSKKKRGNCLSCAGDADKDDPYRKTQERVDYNLRYPDGSLEIEKPGKLDISASSPDFQRREETKDLSFNSTEPNFDVLGPNKGVSTEMPEISLHANDPSVGTPDVSFPSGDIDISHSGAGDISSKRPKVGIEANSPDIDGPKGRFDRDISAPDADIPHGKLRGPGAQVNAPSGQLNFPSIKKKRGTCLSCAGDGDKDDPYRKTQGNVGYDFSGPDGSMEMENRSKVDIKAPGAGFQGRAQTNDTSLEITKPDFDIEGPNRGISTGPPEISLHTKDPSINNPDASFPSGSTNISLSGARDISSKRPEVEIEENSPDIDGPKGRFNTEILAPGVDVSQDKLRDPTAAVNAPSGQFNVPSTKKRGVNCL
ncbi:neuroblast differentiation-associated protein AHNAK-like [Stylophora pistillata]|uniref:neuroblast differentiation-associated protein AHNAK-like n=1 Tax=Stylophora pistillata TaxID=50429 RepID=UPI000C03A3CA|nr:neuroblast differentiation-associated protein AHNAK-like [Stylophora pistillata]